MDDGPPHMPIPFLDGDYKVGGSTKEHLKHDHPHEPPPYSAQPPSGNRVALSSGTPFPTDRAREPPCRDLDGSPVYIGSAIFERSVHPCKIAPHLPHHCRVPYGGSEHEHHERYDLLPFDRGTMEWVSTERGLVPKGWRPVNGGYEEGDGGPLRELYHAMRVLEVGHQRVGVPGKTGLHLGGCRIPFGGSELEFTDHYQILCWK